MVHMDESLIGPLCIKNIKKRPWIDAKIYVFPQKLTK